MENRARLLAVSCPESGAWLQALLLSSIGFRIDDDVVCIAVNLRLGVAMCHPHVCACCGVQVNSLGTHGLSCRLSKDHHCRHATINDILKHALKSGKFLSHLQPSGLYRSDSKRPYGATVVPWKCGKILVRDATCMYTFAPSYQALAARGPRAVATDGEHGKHSKYELTRLFTQVAVETLGAMGPDACSLLKEIHVAWHITSAIGEERVHEYLLQRVAVAILCVCLFVCLLVILGVVHLFHFYFIVFSVLLVLLIFT